MNLKAFSLNEIGGRKNVEDAIMPKQYAQGAPQLFIVCDGVGGSSFGEVASEIATTTYYEVFEKAVIGSEKDFIHLLQTALILFKSRVADFIATNPTASNTSTTFTLLTIQQNQAFIAWCGDSKVFQIRKGKPIFKSKDHSLVAELTAQGVITEAEAETHPQRNIITRSFNVQTKPTDIDTVVLKDIQNEDWFLLCTDGLMEQFTESHFNTVLGEFKETSNYSEIIENICYGKTKDNYSMYLLHVTQTAAKSAAGKIGGVLLFLLLAAGGWYAYSQFIQKKTEKASVSIDQSDTAEVKSIMMTHPVADTSMGNGSNKVDSIKKDTTLNKK